MESLNKAIFKVGSAIRNPSLKKKFLFLKESERWSYDQLYTYQFNVAKEFLEFANKYSPFYKKIFSEVGFNPFQMQSIEDIKAIPVLTKTILLKNVSLVHSNYPFKKKFYSETSGTSGQPLKFFKDEEWDSHNRAAIFRGYSWHGVQPWERNGYFWGYNISKDAVLKTKFLDLLQNRFRLFSYNREDILEFVNKLSDAQYLHGYSSMIYEVAKIINTLGIRSDIDLKLIKGTSEKIFESYQQEVVKAFGRRIISEYGSAESGIIAFECPSGSMHINIENVIVEVENGEIIVTNIISRSFPVIRYRLGDAIVLEDSGFKCSCGLVHPVIREVTGRVGKVVHGFNNSYPSLTFYYVFKNLALTRNILLNYQAVQREVGYVEIFIEQGDCGYEKVLREELSRYFSNDVVFSLVFSSPIHAMDGKLRDFISYLSEIS